MIIVISIIVVLTLLFLLLFQSYLNVYNGAKYAPSGRLHSIGNRKLHIQVKGQMDGPVVVFDHNCEYGQSSLSWQMVVERVQHFAKVVVFDRSGYGWSEGGAYPRTNITNVEDIRQLLLAENIKGPIIYVGHGYGAIDARLFALRYPKQVSGIILIDPWHEEEQSGKFPEAYNVDKEKRLKAYKRYVSLAPWGFVKPILLIASPIREYASYYSAALAKKIRTISALKKTIKAIHSEAVSVEVGYNQIRNVKEYKNTPITVLISGGEQQASSIRQAKYEMASELKNLSEEGLLIVAPNSKHNVPVEQPELVADAIRRMITYLKKEYV